MDNLSEHYENLLLGKITGSLDDEEEAELNELLQRNPAVQQAYASMLERFPAEISANNFELLDQPGYWKDLSFLSPRTSRRTGIISLYWKLAGVAAAVILIAGVWLYRDNSNKEITAPVVKKTGGIELQLANGKKINLSAQEGQLHAGNATLNNTNKTLQYSVAGNEGTGINTVTVPVGMDYKIVLSDGSKVWMNSVTRLDFPFRFINNKREITIDGEAYLEVAKDPAKPFIVHLPNGSVQVLGTAFNVNSYDTSLVRVSLVNGQVNINTNRQKMPLTPGKQAVYNQSKIIEQPFNSKTELSWRQGLYYFEGASLQELEPVLKRWFGLRVQIENTELRQKSFAGVIDKNQPLQVFLDDLKAMSKITSFIGKDNVIHFE